jgi:hypothetical protein
MLSGCGPSLLRVYPGPALPFEQVARVSVPNCLRDGGARSTVFVGGVDDHHGIGLGTHFVEALPGPHVLSVSYSDYISNPFSGWTQRWDAHAKIRCDMKAGRYYFVHSQASGGSWNPVCRESVPCERDVFTPPNY